MLLSCQPLHRYSDCKRLSEHSQKYAQTLSNFEKLWQKESLTLEELQSLQDWYQVRIKELASLPLKDNELISLQERWGTLLKSAEQRILRVTKHCTTKHPCEQKNLNKSLNAVRTYLSNLSKQEEHLLADYQRSCIVK